MSKNWGHKLTVHIYVTGDMQDALDVSEQVCEILVAKLDSDPRMDFMGVGVEEVKNKPYDQGAS